MKHKETFAAVMHSRGAKFTADVKAGKYEIPPLKPGHEVQRFYPGDRVEFIAGTGREGMTHVVQDAVQENGYWSIGLVDCFARQADLRHAR